MQHLVTAQELADALNRLRLNDPMWEEGGFRVAGRWLEIDPEASDALAARALRCDLERARQLGREVGVRPLPADWGAAVVRLAKENGYGLVVIWDTDEEQAKYVRRHAPCPVFMATLPAIPTEAVAQ